MFTKSPRYSTLTRQVVRELEAGMGDGSYKGVLPGERWLASSMQVSRRTIRAAIEILRQKNLVKTIDGRETRILQTAGETATLQTVRTVGLVMPEPAEHFPPYASNYFERLRTLFYQNGIRLDTHISRSCFTQRPGAALTRLTTRFPCDAWLLAFSNRASQSWFQSQNKSAVVIGSTHEGIMLPFVDVDLQSASRHAVTSLLQKGHRHIALIMPESYRAGDVRTERGFMDGAARFPANDVHTQVFKHASTMESLRSLTDRILRLEKVPTALFIVNPYYYLAIAGFLGERGLNVPRDISLMCRDDDYCLRYLSISPSRYTYNIENRARATFSMVMSITQPQANRGKIPSVLMPPTQLDGASVAPPRSRSSLLAIGQSKKS